MSASSTISRMAARVLWYTAGIAELQSTLFLAPVLSQCEVVRHMAHSASLQPQWQTEAAEDPARSAGPPRKAGRLAQRRSARVRQQHNGMPLHAQAAADVVSSQDRTWQWRPPAATTRGASASPGTMYSSAEAVSDVLQPSANSSSAAAAARAQGTLHWSASFEPVQVGFLTGICTRVQCVRLAGLCTSLTLMMLGSMLACPVTLHAHMHTCTHAYMHTLCMHAPLWHPRHPAHIRLTRLALNLVNDIANVLTHMSPAVS
jgi:hypothetical protein